MALNDKRANPMAYKHPDYVTAKERWDLIRDCVAGQKAIKAKSTLYLPMPNCSDKSEENKQRYRQYKERANFVNVCDRTKRGLVGEVFAIKPDILLDDERMMPLVLNVDGGGTSLTGLAKLCMAETVSIGRGGLLVDYPSVGAIERTTGRPFTTRAEQLAGKVRPFVSFYRAEQIINWAQEMRDNVLVTTLVVLEEVYTTKTDGFRNWTGNQWRILRLNKEGFYTQEIRRDTDAKSGAGNGPGVGASPQMSGGSVAPAASAFQPETIIYDADGQPFKEILFKFIGSEDNNPDVDGSPVYDIAELNISQYRNSADYEESVYLVGQPTLWISGLTQTWVDKNYTDKKITFGAFAPLVLPAGAQCGILQVKENVLAKEAMQLKSEQMAALGARLVQHATVERTATESFQDSSSDASVLASCADNVSEALTWALNRAGMFVDVSLGERGFHYTLSTDFMLARMDPAMRLQLMKEWQAGSITWQEYRTALKRANVAYEDDVVAQKEKDAMLADQLKKELALKTAAKANVDPGNPGGANNQPSA